MRTNTLNTTEQKRGTPSHTTLQVQSPLLVCRVVRYKSPPLYRHKEPAATYLIKQSVFALAER